MPVPHLVRPAAVVPEPAASRDPATSLDCLAGQRRRSAAARRARGEPGWPVIS
jgi:hypothetical protein